MNLNFNEILDMIIIQGGQWLITSGLRIVLYIIGAMILVRVVRRIGKAIIARYQDDDPTTKNEQERRAETLVSVLKITTKIAVWTIVLFMVLREIGANITPLLTGAGIVGLAVGFGAQNIVRDFFSGFLILLENQYRVGDVIQIADRAGLVESINLRTTSIRNLEGVLHIIPNGEIKAVDNYTFSESRQVIDVGISYNSSMDKAIEVIEAIGEEMKNMPEFAEDIRAFEILGIQRLGDSSVDIRVKISTEPLKQWAIGRKFRYLVKKRFDENDIEIPFPHRTVYFRTEDDLKPRISIENETKQNNKGE
ncbi:MAG TPA: mechanosensitive ion channel family protein [candidate division Zixibacteria bacterium]|nr:mechanosensitive ion channel family protein [candidate division Zixibacteria bacterium]